MNQDVAPASGAWRALPAALHEDAALIAEVLAIHRELRVTLCAREMTICNQEWDIEARALRRIEEWRVLLLLTPWMLARLLIPDGPPLGLQPPADCPAACQANADGTILGPACSFTLLGQPQRAHLNYDPRLGHYLLQPLCLEMSAYRNAEEVFAAWNEVIRIRDANLEQARRDCPLQREISRREFFRLNRHNAQAPFT